MISHKHRCIFIHIPKCAGTSIASALGHQDDHLGRGGPKDHRSVRMIEKPLLTLNTFTTKDNIREMIRRLRHKYLPTTKSISLIGVTKEEYSSYYKFTFVRNPWSRAYSWYRNVMRSEMHRTRLNITDDIPLRNFLRKFSGRRMLRPQSCWLKSFGGDINLDYIGRFENLAEDFKNICAAIHAPHITLPHKMKGSGEAYHDQYDAESIEIITHDYREDIERFGYTFGDDG